MKYKYSGIYDFSNTNKRLIKRPIVEIELFNNGNSIKGAAVIDSGADKSLFNIAYAKEIGIDLTNAHKEEFMGIGGTRVSCFVTIIEIKMQHIDEKYKIEAGFIESDAVNILLGQEGFFDQNRIRFEKDHDTFEIIPAKKK